MLQYALLMLLAGIGISVLPALNATLGPRSGSFSAAATVLFGVAFISSAVVAIATDLEAFQRVAEASKHMLLAGALIAFYVLTITYDALRFGVDNAVSSFCCGN